MARYTKGQTGNKAGRPKGSPDWRSKLRTQIEEAAPDLIKQLLVQAKGGDTQAIKLLLDKVLPNVKPETLPVPIPFFGVNINPADAILDVINQMTKGGLSLESSEALISAISALVKVREAGEIEKRVMTLEELVSGSFEGGHHGNP